MDSKTTLYVKIVEKSYYKILKGVGSNGKTYKTDDYKKNNARN